MFLANGGLPQPTKAGMSHSGYFRLQGYKKTDSMNINSGALKLPDNVVEQRHSLQNPRFANN